jgi:hypothetical protein
LNFVGSNVTVVGAGTTKTIEINGGNEEIHGATGAPTTIDPGWTLAGNIAEYSEFQRGFKFFVTLTMPVNHLSQTFEVLGNVSGNLGANTETVSFNRTARVGYNFAGSVNLVLNTTLKQVSLVWTNNEANPIVIQCVRIQHAP